MKMKDILTFSNCLFVYDQINEDMPSNFEDFFTTSENQHPYNTRGRKNNTIIKTLSSSTTYGLNSADINLLLNGMKQQKLSIL